MKNYKEPNFKKLAIAAAVAAAFTAPLTAHALTVSPLCIGTVAAGVCTSTQPAVAKPLFKLAAQTVANSVPVVITADNSAVYLGRQSAFSINISLAGAVFNGTVPALGAPILSALLATAGGGNTADLLTANGTVTAGGVSGAGTLSGFWTFTVAGGGNAGDSSITYTVSPKTGVTAAGVVIVPTISAGTLAQLVAGAIAVKTHTLGTGGTVTITETVRDPASGLDLSTATTATLFTAANPITYASTAGSATQKIDVGTDTTHGSKTYFSSTGVIKLLDSAYFTVSNYTIGISGAGSSGGSCYGVTTGLNNCILYQTAANAIFNFDAAADTQTITLGGTNLAAFATTGANVYITTATVGCATAAPITSATTLTTTSITVSGAPMLSAGGTYQVCLKVPTSLTNTITAQTLTQSVAVTFGNATALTAETAYTAAAAALTYNGTVREVYFFNPAINTAQVSLLRVTNPGTTPGTVYVSGVNDAGTAGTGTATFTLPAGQAVTLTGAELETGVAVAPNPALTGALGAGLTGKKWHLTVTGEFANMAVQSVTRDTGGSISNMSGIVNGPTAQNAN